MVHSKTHPHSFFSKYKDSDLYVYRTCPDAKRGKICHLLFQIIDFLISWAPVADGNGGTMA